MVEEFANVKGYIIKVQKRIKTLQRIYNPEPIEKYE